MLFVSEAASSRLRAINASGAISSLCIGMSAARGVAVDEDGNPIVSGSQEVLKCNLATASGSAVRILGTGSPGWSSSVMDALTTEITAPQGLFAFEGGGW
jgi:hypothetical protein